MPEIKKAELIQSKVYMGSPVSSTRHAEPDNLIQGLLFYYAQSVQGVIAATNATVRLGPDDVIQPDALLRKTPEAGGRCRPDPKGCLVGPPELVVEIAATSASIDLHEKRDSCRRSGVQEYLVWETGGAVFHWWQLVEDDYVPIEEAGGILGSVVFPGLRLHVPSLLARDARRALRELASGSGLPK